MGHDLNPSVIIRRANRALVMEALARQGELGRSALCAVTGLTAPGLSRVTRELIDAGLVIEISTGNQNKQVGRPSSLLRINPDGAYVFGVTLSANRLSIALYDATLEKIEQTEISTGIANQPKRIIRSLVKKGIELIGKNNISRSRLAGVGVSIGTPVLESQLAGGIVTSEVLGWQNIPIAELLSNAFHLPVKIEPRYVALLRTEIDLAGYPDDSCVFLINCAVRIGCSGMSDGKLLLRNRNNLIDLMHTACTNASFKCKCGRTGCLGQASAGVGALRIYMGEQLLKLEFSQYGTLLKDLLKKAAAGDARAQSAFKKSGGYMAYGVDLINALFAPDEILISGEVGRQSDFVSGLRQKLRSIGGEEADQRIRISNATSDQAAANIARHAFVLSRDLDFNRFQLLEQSN